MWYFLSIQMCMVKPSLELIYVFARKKSDFQTLSSCLIYWLANTFFNKLQQFKQKQVDLFSYWIWTGLNCFSWNNAEVGP